MVKVSEARASLVVDRETLHQFVRQHLPDMPSRPPTTIMRRQMEDMARRIMAMTADANSTDNVVIAL